jgi:transposase
VPLFPTEHQYFVTETIPERVRELLIRQRTQAINALRSHLTEFGQVAPKGAANISCLIAIVDDPGIGPPDQAVATLRVLVDALAGFDTQIAKLNAEISDRAKENEVARRLMTIPDIAVLAPPPVTFRRGRDFVAWLGLVPRQHSTGGKQRLGATTKMGERSLRRLLIIGANNVIIKRRVHQAARPGTWLAGMLSRKPPMLVRVALANKMARVVWALMIKGESYRAGCGGISRPSVARRRSGRGQGVVWHNGRETGPGKPVCNRVPLSTRL